MGIFATYKTRQWDYVQRIKQDNGNICNVQNKTMRLCAMYKTRQWEYLQRIKQDNEIMCNV